jgi:L,D-peptidoglycan transpeptidase YkuD (ErfK/YbiS/YcfS/YnhG family)
VRVGRAEPALVGEGGLAWGLGLHTAPHDAMRRKREGDRCAPAGVFRITGAFSQLAHEEVAPLRLPWRHVTAELVAVDDPGSRFYNQIVDAAKVARPDWRSAERLAEIRSYRLALTIAHNPRNEPGAGSCIFLHEWMGRSRGTAGCTVLRWAALLEVARWLDPAAEPVIVQMPHAFSGM